MVAHLLHLRKQEFVMDRTQIRGDWDCCLRTNGWGVVISLKKYCERNYFFFFMYNFCKVVQKVISDSSLECAMCLIKPSTSDRKHNGKCQHSLPPYMLPSQQIIILNSLKLNSSSLLYNSFFIIISTSSKRKLFLGFH